MDSLTRNFAGEPPIFPFFWQYNTTSKKITPNTSSTYTFYQMLIDKIRAEIEGKQYEKSQCITFFRDCFITELNDLCLRNHKDIDNKKQIENQVIEHIRNRLEWMRKTNFYNHFKIVILACGPYAKSIKEDSILRNDMFGNAKIVYCGQLSQWRKLDLEGDETHPNQIKEIAALRPKISSAEDNKRYINCLPFYKPI